MGYTRGHRPSDIPRATLRCRDATTDEMIGTHRLGDTPGEGGARERVRDVQGYMGGLIMKHEAWMTGSCG